MAVEPKLSDAEITSLMEIAHPTKAPGESRGPWDLYKLTATIPGDRPQEAPPEDKWTPMHPGNISPFVAYLATETCPIHGRVFFVYGGQVFLFKPFSIVDEISKEGFWTVEELQKEGARFADVELDLGHPMGSMLWGGPG